MKNALLLRATVLALVAATAVAAPEDVHLSHDFGGHAAELVLHPIAGQLRHGGKGGGVALDLSDYSQAGTLVLPVEVVAGPLVSGHAVVPADTYAIDFVPQGPEGLPVIVLTSTTGLRLRLAMPQAPRPSAPVDHLAAEEVGGATDETRWTFAIHAPLSSALLVLERADAAPPPAAVAATPGGEGGEGGDARVRRKSRADVIREKGEARPGRERPPVPPRTTPTKP